MSASSLFLKIMLALAGVLLLPCAHAAKPTQGGKSVKSAEAQASLREVGYESLESRIGSVLVIHTSNDTTRRGTLLRYTKVSLTMQLGPESGSIELAVPRNTIRKIMLEIGPADPLFPQQETQNKGKPGAKTN